MEFSREQGIEDQQFLCLIQDSFLTQHVLEPTRGEMIRYSFVITTRISGQCKKYLNHWVIVTIIKYILTSM